MTFFDLLVQQGLIVIKLLDILYYNILKFWGICECVPRFAEEFFIKNVMEMSKTTDQNQTSTLGLVDLDHRTPGEVYLCQISSTVSCGACCGLYNVKNLSREKLTRKTGGPN